MTVQPETNELIGLHLDDWYGFALADRARAPNRICINLGREDRFLLFLNMPIGKMCEEVDRACGGKATLADGGTSIGRMFMSLFPSYPAFRARIRPGEAYIAPTECLVHDGSSIEMSTMDVSMQIRGRFELTAIA